MTSTGVRLSVEDRLPPLGGGLLWCYRTAFALLALGAAHALALPLFAGLSDPVVTGLRSVKGLALLTLAGILFRRRQQDPVAGLLSLAFLSWTITSSVDFTSADLAPQLLDRVRFLLFALALLLFPNGDWQPRWTRHVAFATVAVFCIGVFEATGIIPGGLFLPPAIGCIVAAIAALISSLRNTDDETVRQQLKWVALGLVAGIGLILSARAGAALGAGEMPILWEAMFQSGIVVVALGFLVSLLRYRLFDAEAFISKSAVYAVLTAALVATFAGSEALIEMLGQRYLGAGIGQVSGAIAAAMAAVLLTPLHGRISAWAEARFQADLVRLKSELPELLWDMPEGWGPEEVANVALPRIAEAIHAGRICLILDHKVIEPDGMGGLRSDDASSFVVRLPMRCAFGRMHGHLCIGPRPDGSTYGRDELSAVEDILGPLRRRLIAAVNDAEHRAQHQAIQRSISGQHQALKAGLDEVTSRTRQRA